MNVNTFNPSFRHAFNPHHIHPQAPLLPTTVPWLDPATAATRRHPKVPMLTLSIHHHQSSLATAINLYLFQVCLPTLKSQLYASRSLLSYEVPDFFFSQSPIFSLPNINDKLIKMDQNYNNSISMPNLLTNVLFTMGDSLSPL